MMEMSNEFIVVALYQRTAAFLYDSFCTIVNINFLYCQGDLRRFYRKS